MEKGKSGIKRLIKPLTLGYTRRGSPHSLFPTTNTIEQMNGSNPTQLELHAHVITVTWNIME